MVRMLAVDRLCVHDKVLVFYFLAEIIPLGTLSMYLKWSNY